jgi:UDP-glucose 6-dehydrogenase
VAELQELYVAGKFEEILDRVKACLPKDVAGNFIAEQEKSDVVHDLLAFLAERMLEMNKQKQQEIKGFLSWLEREVGAKVEGLTPKTKVQEYYKQQFDELLAILKKNKRKLADYDPARRDKQEDLLREFDASVGKLKPLMERIAATDGLIDQIVYKLYGLTEEEIGIVKGKAAS